MTDGIGATSDQPSFSPPSANLFGIDIHQVDMPAAVRWATERMLSEWTGCELVFTPNVDHVVQLSHSRDLRDAYRSAGLVLADGWPIVTASRWLGKSLPCRVPGSEFVPQLLATSRSDRPARVFLLGGAEGVPEVAAERIVEQWPSVDIVGVDSPPFGFEHDDAEEERIVELVADAEPDLLVVGFGAPKQELWLARTRPRLHAKVAVAAGATIDFLAGRQTRAPRWVQRCRMEWLHRLATNPRRLAGRYLQDAIVFPQLVLRERSRR
ncbi:putative N-acetylmannosaminyltransferase [Posidoniimonas polymericola]|uniref:Putative N-acetylmannosaminyltransferase n=1 Tax=Posidoniimonas polymericola TaxID=2528002 RepID=A0A5C5ZEX8_9BACT|nr:WecB/TagA/CpsF family glycosyltransferase [Posidoniimonas polymericola]TWT85924.1 putative N-acetylmannosaminyltransferase [Posidoniimonas polymericola]